MRDPYLYDDVDVLKNLANIKESKLLRTAEADITNLTIAAVYQQCHQTFDVKTLQEIHQMIFGQIYDWAGEFRTIPMIKREDILGGDTVRYAHPSEIKKQLTQSTKEIRKLKQTPSNDKDIVFRIVRITAAIWQTHPFREGNTRACIVFAVLLAKKLGFSVNHALFQENAIYVRNALVWASQGMYAKYEYLERIFFDAMLPEDTGSRPTNAAQRSYEMIGEYSLKDYQERSHQYVEKHAEK